MRQDCKCVISSKSQNKPMRSSRQRKGPAQRDEMTRPRPHSCSAAKLEWSPALPDSRARVLTHSIPPLLDARPSKGGGWAGQEHPSTAPCL